MSNSGLMSFLIKKSWTVSIHNVTGSEQLDHKVWLIVQSGWSGQLVNKYWYSTDIGTSTTSPLFSSLLWGA